MTGLSSNGVSANFSGGDVTIAVQYFKSEATIGTCLEALLCQTARPARIIVVDDASPEPYHSQLPLVEVIRLESNVGLAAGRNIALGVCGTSLMGSIDSDVAPEPEWLERMLSALNDSQSAVGVGGRLTERFQDTLGDRWRASHMAQHWGDFDAVNPRFLYGANTLFHVGALRSVGGYDVRMRTNNEDRTVSEALYALGHDLLYAADARCWHLRRDTAASILPGYWKWHHVKGFLEGHFTDWERLAARIGAVDFGIFRYRFDMDERLGRAELLSLDAALPWVFCIQDLYQAERQMGVPISVEPVLALARDLAGEAVWPFLSTILNRVGCVAPALASPEWMPAYLEELRKCLEQSGWIRDCAGVRSFWDFLSNEIVMPNGLCSKVSR